MKFRLPLALVILLSACSTPEDKEAAHQRQLYEEARANFLALKARERKTSPAVAARHAKPTPAPAGGFRWPAQAGKPARVKSKPKPRNDDTIYYWNMPGR